MPPVVKNKRFLRSGLQASARYLLYPAMMGCALGAAWWLRTQGLSQVVVLASISAVVYLLAIALERMWPYQTEWRSPSGDVATDVWGLILSVTIAGGAAQMLALALSWPLSSWLCVRTGFSWPSAWPLWLQIIMAVAILDLGTYFVHRLQHEHSGFLWRLHSAHHSASRMYFLNGNRNHPGDSFISTFVMMIPLGVLGASPNLLMMLGILGSVHVTLQHANIDYRLGPLNWIINAAEVHRWHHSRLQKEANANYGGISLLWDLIFRTRRVPCDRSPPIDVGLFEPMDFPKDYLGQFLAPFRKRLWK